MSPSANRRVLFLLIAAFCACSSEAPRGPGGGDDEADPASASDAGRGSTRSDASGAAPADDEDDERDDGNDDDDDDDDDDEESDRPEGVRDSGRPQRSDAADDGLTVGGVTGCRGKSVSAPPPSTPKVDIVWVIDASGSMLDEQIKVGQNLTQFADDIAAAQVDLRIVMLTRSPAIPVICPPTPDDPLTGTPLASDPRYRFVRADVDSNNSLNVAISSYPQYRDFLRPDAALNFVFLTDDESLYQLLPSAAQRAQRFREEMRQLAGKDFTAHTISSPGPLPCGDPMCMPDINTGICFFVMLGCGAASPGDTYYALADETGGLQSSICEGDWSRIFGPLTEAVVMTAPLPCDYEIPEPPEQEVLDPRMVNLGWIAAGSSEERILPKVSEQAACGEDQGWYYDDETAPSRVLLCPAACGEVAMGGQLNIAFGCLTVLVQ